jgi:nucleoside-diphosphate-sugar epimerase
MHLAIVGKGLIATTFSRISASSTGLVIYASGVSDSRCTDEREFKRERQLLNSTLLQYASPKAFIYFSTCSVYDPELGGSPYVLHKKRMEEFVLSHPKGYVIRMPQLVGSNAPPNTLVPSLVSKIRRGETVEVWTEAHRNLIDVEDAALIVSNLFSSIPPENHVINVANPDCISIFDLVNAIETVVQLKAETIMIPKGSKYWIDTRQAQVIAQQAGIAFGPGYISKILMKYYS